jgi:hypothetical protein
MDFFAVLQLKPLLPRLVLHLVYLHELINAVEVWLEQFSNFLYYGVELILNLNPLRTWNLFLNENIDDGNAEN